MRYNIILHIHGMILHIFELIFDPLKDVRLIWASAGISPPSLACSGRWTSLAGAGVVPAAGEPYPRIGKNMRILCMILCSFNVFVCNYADK